MWWEPTSDWERVLAEDVRELRRWKFEDPIASEIGCFGIGSIWSEYDEGLVPFVLVSREIRAWTWEGTFQRMRNGWLLRLIRPAFPAIPRLRLPLYFAVLKEPRPTNTATATQIAADRLIDTFVRVREPIGPDIKATGTAGVIAWTKHKMPVVLTAGHVFPNGVGSEAFRFHSRWPHLRWLRPPERSSIGAVWKHMVPKSGGPGWDVAVILSDPVISTLVEAPLVARQYKRFQSAEKIRVHGAYSGLVTRAVVQGALTDLGSWTNCWMVGPSGLLRDGDSGAAVFVDRDASLLGLYVAKSEHLFRG